MALKADTGDDVLEVRVGSTTAIAQKLTPRSPKSPGTSNLLTRRTDRSGWVFGQEAENETRDLVVLLVEGEMAGVKQVQFGVRQITLVCLRSRSDERGIIPPPDHQGRRLVLAQPCLPRRVRSDVRAIIVEQISLDFALPGSR